MTAFKTYKPTLLLAACFLSIGVQASTCITAGRMDNAVWAPQFQSVRLLDDAGRNLKVKNKSELTQVRAVEFTVLPVIVGKLPPPAPSVALAPPPPHAAKKQMLNISAKYLAITFSPLIFFIIKRDFINVNFIYYLKFK